GGARRGEVGGPACGQSQGPAGGGPAREAQIRVVGERGGNGPLPRRADAGRDRERASVHGNRRPQTMWEREGGEQVRSVVLEARDETRDEPARGEALDLPRVPRGHRSVDRQAKGVGAQVLTVEVDPGSTGAELERPQA